MSNGLTSAFQTPVMYFLSFGLYVYLPAWSEAYKCMLWLT